MSPLNKPFRQAVAVAKPAAPSPAPEALPVPSNPAMVEFPRDVWGFTTELRKALLKAAGSVRGNSDKHDVLMQTIRVGAQHAFARLDGDAGNVAAKVAALADKAASRYEAGRVSNPAA